MRSINVSLVSLAGLKLLKVTSREEGSDIAEKNKKAI
jgi:hypothetical protein